LEHVLILCETVITLERQSYWFLTLLKIKRIPPLSLGDAIGVMHVTLDVFMPQSRKEGLLKWPRYAKIDLRNRFYEHKVM
jgi:hypothetical protein